MSIFLEIVASDKENLLYLKGDGGFEGVVFLVRGDLFVKRAVAKVSLA